MLDALTILFMSVPIYVRISKELDDKIESLALVRQLPKTDLFREILEKAVTPGEAKLDIGIVENVLKEHIQSYLADQTFKMDCLASAVNDMLPSVKKLLEALIIQRQALIEQQNKLNDVEASLKNHGVVVEHKKCVIDLTKEEKKRSEI